jgi:hypothetical protein
MKRFVLLAAFALVACADPHQPLSQDFGNSVAADIAAQVVNPKPALAGSNDSDGQRVGNAIDRYRTNKIIKPHLPLEGGKIFDQPLNQQ